MAKAPQHIVLNALNLRPGGGLKIAEAIASGLLAQKNAVRVTVLWSDPKSGTHLQDVFGGDENVHLVCPVRRRSNLAVFAWQMTRLGGYLRRLGADALICLNHHFPSSGVFQIVYHVNVLRFERDRQPLTRLAELADRLRDWRSARALAAADVNVFESRFLRDLAEGTGPTIRNPELIYIGRDGRSATYDRSDDYSPTLLSLTSPQPHKDNETLIQTLAQLRTDRPEVDWHLKVAGGASPDAFADLKALAETLGIGRAITWLGFQSHDVLAEHGTTALCHISTSRIESFSMVSIEAMNWGCPPIVANTSAMPESVADAGLLAEPGSAADFARCVQMLWDDPALRAELVTKGRKRVADLTWENAGRQFLSLCNERSGS